MSRRKPGAVSEHSTTDADRRSARPEAEVVREVLHLLKQLDNDQLQEALRVSKLDAGKRGQGSPTPQRDSATARSSNALDPDTNVQMISAAMTNQMSALEASLTKKSETEEVPKEETEVTAQSDVVSKRVCST